MTEADYTPRGNTALLDAIGGAVHHIKTIHRYIREEDRPEKTIFVIITDGMENSSRRYDADEVRHMVEERREKAKWEFLFLGANIDAVTAAGRVGITEDRAVTYKSDSEGTALNYETVSKAVGRMRRESAPIDGAWKAGIEADVRRRGQ